MPLQVTVQVLSVGPPLHSYSQTCHREMQHIFVYTDHPFSFYFLGSADAVLQFGYCLACRNETFS